MDGRKSLSRDPNKQIILAAGFVIIVYALLLGRQGRAQDVFLASGFTFVSYGERGGVRIYQMQDPVRPVEVGAYDTAGSARSMTLAGTFLYIADGLGGLRVLNVANPAVPDLIGSLRLNADIYDVALSGSFAYLAAGDRGLLILDATYPNNPYVLSELNTPGIAQAVAVRSFVMMPPGVNQDLSPRPGLQGLHVFLADGQSGLRVIDVSLPTAPSDIFQMDLDGEVQDILLQGNLAYIAAGEAGLVVLDLTNPAFPFEIARFDTAGDAHEVILSGSNLYVADREGGLAIINPVDQTVTPYQTDGEVLGAAIQDNMAYIADGTRGLRVLNLNNGRTLALIEVPGEASFTQLIRGLFQAATGRLGSVQGKVWRTFVLILFDVLLFAIALVFWQAVFAQFVLPVSTNTERRQVFQRVRNYVFGNRGPAIFIENGEVLQREKEEDRAGPGVALLDTASAAVFRNQHAITKVVGPGVIFTDGGEYTAGVVDLHRQSQVVGPRENENPYMPRQEGELPELFEQRKSHRYETSALTRDGVEVVPNVGVAFSVINEPNEGKTYFGYNSDAVWRAIAHEAINPDAPLDSDRRRFAWHWLPVRLAVDVWREYLRKFTLDELFTYTSTGEPQDTLESRKTAFDTITEMVKDRLTKPEVQELNDQGQVVEGSLKPSKEYQVLCERGIRVYSVSIRSLRFPQSVEKQLVQHWITTWLQRAREEQKEVERVHAEKRISGHDIAVKEFALTSAQPVALAIGGASGLDEDDGGSENEETVVSGQGLSLAETVRLLLQGTLKLCIREHLLHPRLTNQKANILEIIEWIEKK